MRPPAWCFDQGGAKAYSRYVVGTAAIAAGSARDIRARGKLRGPVKVGCTGGVMLLTLLLFAGFLFLNRGVRWTMRRARARLERSLPGELTPADRTRLENDLNHFFATVAREPDSTRRMGQFLGHVERMLDDGRVTIPEVHDLCRFLERASKHPAPARISHHLSTPAGDVPHAAAFSRPGLLDVLPSTTERPLGQKHHIARRLGVLVSRRGEECGLAHG